jgi:hypothetical protein
LYSIFKWTPTGGWSQLTQYHFNGAAWVMAIYGSYLYFAGVFDTGYDSSLNPVMTLNNIGRIRLSDGLMQPLGSGLVGSVRAMAVGDTADFSAGDFLYVAGTVTQAGGNAVNNIARWNGTRWDGMSGGLPVSNPGGPYVMDGVWGISVDTVYPSYPSTYPAHRVVATGHFNLGPNIAVHYPSANWTYQWSGLQNQTGIANICLTDPPGCAPYNCWDRSSTVRNLVNVGNNLYFLSVWVTRINNYYIFDNEPTAQCGLAPRYFSQAKATRTTSTYAYYFPNIPISLWDGSEGWQDMMVGHLYAYGSTIYGIGSRPPNYDMAEIGTYGSGSWTTLATFTEGWSGQQQNVLSKSSAGLFLATPYYPKRWQ